MDGRRTPVKIYDINGYRYFLQVPIMQRKRNVVSRKPVMLGKLNNAEDELKPNIILTHYKLVCVNTPLLLSS